MYSTCFELRQLSEARTVKKFLLEAGEKELMAWTGRIGQTVICMMGKVRHFPVNPGFGLGEVQKEHGSFQLPGIKYGNIKVS